MKKQFFRVCSILLTVALLVNMLPMSIFAQELQESLTADAEAVPVVTETEDAHIVTEIPSKRTQYSKEFLLSNGLHLATVYADPVHYEKDGTWAEIDNTLVAKSDGTYRNTAGVWNVSFPQQLSGSKCVTIEKDGYTLSFTMAGELRSSGELMTAAIGTAATEQLAVSQMQTATAAIQQIDTAALEQGYIYPEAAPKKLDSQLRYNNIYANTDMVYDLQSDMVKESIVMESYSSTLRGYRYTLNVGQLVPVMSEDGEITFYTPDEKTVVMVMPAPYLLDANNEYNDDIQVQLTGKGSIYTLTYLLPTQWLGAAERAWPVILDPVVKASRDKLAIRDQTVCENKSISETKTVLDAGYSEERGKIRAYLKYTELPQLTSSDVVVQAVLTLHKVQTSSTSKTVEVHKVTEAWPDASLTWANQPDFAEDISDFAYVQNEGLHNWIVTEIVRSWYTNENNGLMIKMSNSVESGASGDYFRQFYSSDTGQYNRPTLHVVFLNNNGLEGTWDYTTTAAGRAGTGSVNNFTGNLTWVRNDMGFGGNRMPVSIDHVYNANDAIVHEDVEGQVNNANDSGGNYFGLGIGWRTNYHQRVFQWECDDATGDSDYYIWEDGDGTDHYFKKSSTNTYKDEEGLEMKLKTGGSGTSTFSISEKKGNTSYFDSKGRLTKIENNQKTKSYMTVTYAADTGYEIDYITDGAGRKYDFTYANGLLSSIVYRGRSTTENHYEVRFEYSDSRLTKIIDNACDDAEDCEACESQETNKELIYAYNDDGILKSATDIDGYKVTYEYTGPDSIQSASQETTTTTSQWEPPYLVEKISTAHGSADGGSMEFTYGYNETRMKDHNGNVQTLQFNDWGHVVGIMDDEGHAQYAKYAATAHTDTGKANQLTFSSKLQNTVGNLLNDSNFENGTLWTLDGSDSIQTISTEKYYGAKSLRVQGNVLGQTFTIGANETYTLSVYAKTIDSGTIGFKIDGTLVNETALPSETDWTRYEVSYTNNTGSNVQATPLLGAQNQDGAYFDCVQLEKAPTASRYNLVENGDFRYTGDNSYWTLHDDCTSLDLYTTPTDLEPAAPQLDGTCFSIAGNRTKTKNIKQTVKVSGSEGDSFIFAGWAAGYAVPLGTYDGDTRRFAVRARFKYTDGKYSDYEYASFQPTIHGWQYAAKAMVAEKDYTEITIGVVYHYNVNTVYFDGIQLFKEEFGSSYTYDEDGNVISVVDLQKKNTTYEYTNNDLTKILENGKEKVTYTYDKYHNVTTAKTEEGLKYTFTYDTYGNNTSVSIGDGDTKITSEAYYHKDDNADNDAERSDEGNRLDYTVDALDKVTTYGYNEITGVLDWVKSPNDTDATKTEYTYDSMFRTAMAECTTSTSKNMSSSYTYTDDYLTSIATPTTTYNFTYGAFGLRESVKVGTQSLATYTYTNDQNKYLQSLNYGNGDRVEYSYDKKGRLETQTYEDGDTVSYAYDNNGALATVTDSATGRTTTYYYDLTDRMMKYTEKGTNFSHSVGYEYDSKNNLTQQVETINGTTLTSAYTYDEDNRVETVTADGTTVEYTYDTYGRIETKVTKAGDNAILTEEYTFTEAELTEGVGTSTQIATHTVTAGTSETVYTYTYDDNGNITSVNYSGNTVTYAYDSANQLIREDNRAGGFTHTWEYNAGGNILKYKQYAYTTDTLGSPTGTVNYGYKGGPWGDLLAGFGNSTFSYDGNGNPLSDYVHRYTWEHGRQLATLTANGRTWAYQYDANGMRVSRTQTNGSTEYTYVYNGSQLVQMQSGTNTAYFTYDASGRPLTMKYNNTLFYYVTNIQGDVIEIRSTSGNLVGKYIYDAWGYPLITSGNYTILSFNPLRYRGYVYDQETGLYYLQSRYYNPEIGRFINADGIVVTGQGFVGNNMFAYCNNNPINLCDCNGCCPHNGRIVELYNANCSSCNFAIVEDDYGLYANLLMYKEHSKKGTTNPSNKNKHQKGQTRKDRDNGGEKGDARRTPNPNKRRNFTVGRDFYVSNNIGSKIWSGVVIVGGSAGVIYLVVNDASIVGAGDDVAIAPLLKIIWDNIANIAK